MMKLMVFFFVGFVFADGPDAGWIALSGKNAKVTKGESEQCAGGVLNVSSEAGRTTVQLGSLIHFTYEKSGVAMLAPEGSEDCRAERKVTEIPGGWQRDVSFSECEDATDNRAYRETLVLKKKVITYERKAAAGDVTAVQCRFKI
ncbi:MAG: hypothetical protein KF789_03320 [Bdellovibrionaceae bacterium]|nr:hypothetical protein [Pseudobdellovibrionaceae bacterium]